MANTEKYFVSLGGDEDALALLEQCFTEPICSVETHTKYGYIVRSEEFNMQPHLSESVDRDGVPYQADIALDIVEHIAESHLKRMNGAMRLIDRNFRSVWVRGVGSLDSGRYKYSIPYEVDRSILFEKDKRATNVVRAWYLASTRDDGVNTVLSAYASSKLGWASLYTIYEVIQADVSGLVYKKGWVTKVDEDKFTATANQCREVDEEMRHGSRPHPNWDASRSMPLWEARRLIETIIWNWLAEKIGDPESECIARSIADHSIDGNYWLQRL